jgi:uroporphyrinogen decarboxylase
MRLYEYVANYKRRLAFPWMATIGLQLTGYKLSEVYLSPQKHLELAIAMDQEFGADFVYPLDDGAIFAETLEVPLLQSDYDFPSTLENPIKNAEDLARLKLLDPYSDGRMPQYLEALNLIANHFEKPLAISLQGPFTLAVELVGITDFARAIIRNPGFVQEVIDFTNQIVGDYAQAVVEAGVRLLCISEPTAVILSPNRFENMVANRLRSLFGRLPEHVWRVLHICGNTNYIMPQMLNCGVEGLSLDQVMNLPEVADQVPEEVVIIGNLDPIYVLRELEPFQVREHTLELLKSMRGYPNFLFSFGCDCTPDTPHENLKAAIEAAQSPYSELRK